MRLLLTISLFLLTFSAFSQTGNFDYLTSNRRFTLAGRTVKGISNDTALLTASADSLVTQYAIRGYIDQRLLNTPDSSYIFDPEQFIVNGWNVSIRFPQDPGEPLFTGSPAYNLTQAHIDFLDSLMLALRDSNYTYFDDRDFYNDGSAALPFRIVRYDNHYIDSLFASVSSGGGGGGGGSGGPYHLPYNADTSYYLGGDSALHKLQTVGSNGSYHLPYNNDTTYVLAGDSTLHKLPTYTPFDSASISRRIDQKQNKLKLTTLGQTGASTLINDTLNIPNYFFATNDSIDYSFASITPIYNENSPGDYVVTGSGVAADRNNTTFPFKLLKSVDVGGWNAGDYVSFKNATTANSTSYTFLRGFVRLKQAEPIGNSLSLEFYNNGVSVSKQVSMLNYGLDKSNVGNYMNVTIPMSAFGFTNTAFDEIRLVFGGGSSAQGLYLDYFLFQNATTVENKYITSVFRSPGTLDVYGVIGGQNVLMHTDSIGMPVDTTSLSNRINLKLNATDTASLSNRINQKLNSSDTASLSSRINVKLNASDTASLSSRINLKEPIIAAGTTSQYWRGDKTWQTLTRERFGIEDNTGIQNRDMELGGKNFYMNSDSSYIELEQTVGNLSGDFTLYGTAQLVSHSTLRNNQSQLNVTPDSFYIHQEDDIKFGGVNNNISDITFPRLAGHYYSPLSVNGKFADATGNITVSSTGGGSTYTDAQARAAISLTTTGTSGAATYNNSTGVLNVPQYAASVGTITWLGTAYNINSGNNITLATPTTSDISEGSNPYFTNARARAAISLTTTGTSGAASYNSTTGVLNIPSYTGGSSTGWSLAGNAIQTGSSSTFGDFIGTTNLKSLRFRTNNTEYMVLDSLGKLVVTNTARTQGIFSGFAGTTAGADQGEIIVGNPTSGFSQLVLKQDGLRSVIENKYPNANTGITLRANGTDLLNVTTGGSVKVTKLLVGDMTQSPRGALDLNNTTGWAYFNNNPTALPSTAGTKSGMILGWNYSSGIGEGVILSDARGSTTTADIRIGSFNGTAVTHKMIVGVNTVSIGTFNYNASTTIGTLAAPASAALSVESTTQGSIPFPKMTSAQKSAIASPVAGLHVYQTDGTEGVYVYKNSGWQFAY